MTAQILTSELTNLIQESKRKNQELKHAAEASLTELKSLPSTSEKQIATDLSRRSQFINPFLIACSSKNSKHAAIGMSCLQRLAAAQALPKSRLKDVLDAITECTSLGFEIQLKILQTLPSLLQNYADQVNGTSFFTVIQICSTLQASKTPSVSSTSTATLQQLVTSLYEKVAAEDKVPTATEIQAGKERLRLRTVAYDAYRFFNDLCLLIRGDKPLVVKFSPTSEPSLLELVESILTGHAAIINSHPEQAYLVKTLLIPYLIKSFSERSVFPVTVRVTRVLYLIIKNHLETFSEETETILQWLNQTLEPENTLLWKRTLCMEVFREIFADVHLVLHIHTRYRTSRDQKPILPSCLASFVRLATEKPALIGLGQHSSVPIGHYFQRESANDQAEAVTAAGSAGVPNSAVPGISVQFSHIRSPCIEQLDKSEAPSTPETYVYSLVLASLNNLAESLAKFIIPLTINTREKSKRHQQSSIDDGGNERLEESLPTKEDLPEKAKTSRRRATIINPLTLSNHSEFENIKATEDLIDSAWHAILASCSTFFHAALDSDNYRALVRSFQKYTQVAGLLHMSVPRDAFLTTLGKNAMPPNLITATIPSANSQAPQTPSSLNNIKGLLNVESIVSQASNFLPERRRQSIDSIEPSLNVRNLLCLRALLNLAIALGPSLGISWTIIFETLQQADRVLAGSIRSSRSVSGSHVSLAITDTVSTAQQITTEVSAVQAAASRVFESTADLSNEAFLSALKSLCSIVRSDAEAASNMQSPASVASPPQTPGHKRRIASFSGLSVKTGIQEHDFMFTLTKLRELATLNLGRFVNTEDSCQSGWDMMLEEMTTIATDQDIPATARLLSVDLIRKLVVDSLAYSIDEASGIEPAKAQARALKPLKRIAGLFRHNSNKYGSLGPDETAIEAHGIVLDTLRSLLEHTGEEITEGWILVLEVIQSAFLPPRMPKDSNHVHDSLRPRLISVALGRSAFSSLQLICSDFLTTNLDKNMPTLIDLLHDFNAQEQEQDVNMSLTTTTFFWKISDFLYTRVSQTALDKLASQDGFDVIDILQSQRNLASEEGIAIIWLYLLRRLSELISDNRDEVRNSAIHTTLRIFDNNGEDMSPKVWQLCFNTVLLQMVSTDIETYSHFRDGEGWTSTADSVASLRTKIGTSQVLLSGLSKLLAAYLDSILSAPTFLALWESFLGSLRTYLSFNLHDLSAAVYEALGTVLSRASSSHFPAQAVSEASSLWDNHVPSKTSELASTLNMAAFESYTTALISNYSLRRDNVTLEETRKIVDNLERCVRDADYTAYSQDLDSMTSLQSKVIKSIAGLRIDIEHASTTIVNLLARFIGLPFQAADGDQPIGQTFIALSKASMTALEDILQEDAAWPELFGSDALQVLFTNLERSIGLKYHWEKQGRNPPLWRKATSASLVILEQAIPKMFAIEIDQGNLRRYWEIIARIAYNIVTAEHLSSNANTDSSVREDEQFDINSLSKLACLITTPLGSASLPESTRRAYTRSLFIASLIHNPSKSDLPDLDSSPLENLYSIRYGRTIATPPCPRQNMAYLCLRTLMKLLSHQDSTAQQIRLAKASAPYTILRAALPLRAYIADQPLRGRLPVPASIRKELVTVLRELGELRCEPAAIPATTEDGKIGGQGAHLVRLFPLVRGAIAVGGPKEIMTELDGWMGRLEQEIGLE